MITKLATAMETHGSEVLDAQVKSVQGTQFVIKDGTGHVCIASKAFGCLVMPEVGDTVLVAHLSQENTHILTILQRPSDIPVKLCTDNDLELESTNGKVRIFGKEGIFLGTAAELKAIAKEFNLSAEQSRVIVNKLLVMGNNVRSKWDKAKLSVESLDSVVGRAVQVFSSRFTRIKKLERLKAKVVHHESEEVYAMRSKFTVLTAKNDVKIDGKQILMG